MPHRSDELEMSTTTSLSERQLACPISALPCIQALQHNATKYISPHRYSSPKTIHYVILICFIAIEISYRYPFISYPFLSLLFSSLLFSPFLSSVHHSTHIYTSFPILVTHNIYSVPFLLSTRPEQIMHCKHTNSKWIWFFLQ